MCTYLSLKKKNVECGNGIAEIEFFFFFWQLWQCHCRKWEKKKILVAEITCEELKKKSATSTIFLQYFHNKSQVISYY